MIFTNTRYYEILGVNHDASIDNIKKAEDRLIRGEPDDRVPYWLVPEVEEAYRILSDPDRRREYDKYLSETEDSNVNEESPVEETHIEEASASDDLAEDQNTPEEVNEEIIDEPVVEDPGVTAKDEEKEDSIEEPEEQITEQAPNNEVKQNQEEVKNKENVDRSNYIVDFTELKENFDQMSFEYKLKTIGKMVGGTILVLSAGPIGWVVAGGVLIAKRKGKYKLHKDQKEKKITPTQLQELEQFKEYENNLNQQMDKLLAEPHNNYRLEINKKKYEAQIELLKKQLELRTNRQVKGRIDLFFNKAQIMQIANQLNSAANNLERVNEKLENYDKEKTPRLSYLNNALINKTIELSEQQQKISVKNLEVKQKRLLHKRNEVGTTMKHRIVRNGKFYDGIVKAKDFVTSRGYAFASLDHIDDRITKIQSNVEEVQSRTR